MAKNIIGIKYNEWTSGKDPLSARIAVFEHIRDIPYAIVPELRDPHAGPPGLLTMNKGSCVPKHFLLALMFEKLGLKIKYATYLFKWDDPRIKYPDELRKLVRRMPVTGHLACKALINGKWVLVDATWDLPLKKMGFPVNERWDGVSDTQNAVIPIEEIVHENLDERVDHSAKQRRSYTDEEIRVYEELTGKLNTWLASVREK
jgi:hypothetical protein